MNVLRSIFNDIANAIRTKCSCDDRYTPAEMSTAIMSIPTSAPVFNYVESKDVDFYRPDGERLASYTKDDVMNPSWQLPEQAEWNGYVKQGWNMTTDDIRNRLQHAGFCDVGATYMANDDVEIHVELTDSRKNVTLFLGQTEPNDISVDWGDGSEQSVLGDDIGVLSVSHDYASAISKSIVRINASNGLVQLAGTNVANASNNYAIYGARSDIWRRNQITYVALGAKAQLSDYAFIEAVSLKTLVLHKDIKNIIPANVCHETRSLRSIILPLGVVEIKAGAFLNATSMQIVSVPETVKSIGPNSIDCFPALSRLSLPVNMTNIGDQAIRSMRSVRRFAIPNGITRIPQYFINDWATISKLVIPDSVTMLSFRSLRGATMLSEVEFSPNLSSIDDESFANDPSLHVLDFRQASIIPKLLNANAFNDMPDDCKIVVPNDLYADWITAANWCDTGIVGHIVKEDDFS